MLEPHESNARPSSAPNDETVLTPGLRNGQQIGTYRIVKRLGFGGMGHVYLALETRLGRHVALKFLPPDLTSDHALLDRLEQEARTASALNHPNILTIYEIGELDGNRFIASEYIDGTTLRAAMEKRGLDAGTAIDVASQVAWALMAAHSAGIVHRDLKPSNIMIRPDGYVKVIDFGIAKSTGAARSDLTSPGAVIGTVAYMSPEQARGADVDARTDLWSLGVVLYEMLAHRRPFDGATDSLLVTAILSQPTPPLRESKSMPACLPNVLQRALAKDPGKRYQTAAEMLADLHHVGQTSGLTSKIRPVVARRLDSRMKWVLAGSMLSIFVIAWAAWWWPLGGKERVLGPNWFRIESVRQVTFNGRTTLASLSPDGNYLAFVVGEPGGEQTLYLKQVESSTEEVKIPPRKIAYAGLTFSPDSKYIFETEKDETLVGRLYAMPILGTRPGVPVIVDIDGPISFSPSGKQFAFVRYVDTNRGKSKSRESAIFIASTDGSDERKLLSVESLTILRRLTWSPKGDRIAAFLDSYLPGQTSETTLDLLDLHGGQAQTALPGWRLIGQACWTRDGRTLIVSASTRQRARLQPQLRQIDLKSGEVYEITKDLAAYLSPSLTSDGLELAAVKQEDKAVLWVSASHDFTHGESASAESERRASLTWPDKNHIILNSNRSGFPNLWLFDVQTQARTDLTNESNVEQQAVAIPGSSSVVFSSNRAGQFHLWRFDPETNRYTQLTFGANYDEAPAVSPDGQWIVYTSWVSNNPHLRKVRLSGGDDQSIGTYPAQDPQISPDGKWIACLIEDPVTSKWTVAIIPLDGSAHIQRMPAAQLPIRWLPDGNALSTVRTNPKGVSNVWAMPLDGSAPRQLTRFDDDMILAFAWSPAGDRLACVRASSGADVALFSRQKNR